MNITRSIKPESESHRSDHPFIRRSRRLDLPPVPHPPASPLLARVFIRRAIHNRQPAKRHLQCCRAFVTPAPRGEIPIPKQQAPEKAQSPTPNDARCQGAQSSGSAWSCRTPTAEGLARRRFAQSGNGRRLGGRRKPWDMDRPGNFELGIWIFSGVWSLVFSI